ncbi:alpha/beta hydrolase [Kitasatospora indigofera]|uniref:alpha/beta hydrolase n=1 Tax=Kitasatospora indigofera TaxID=67307 RepID=UPI003635FA40
MDIATLRDARPADLYEAATAYDKLAENFGRHAGTWKDGVDTRVKNSQWTGSAADQAETSLSQTTAKLSAAQIELGMIGPVLRDGAEAFLLAQSKLLDALEEAKAGGYTVTDDGGVSWPPVSAGERHDPDFENPSVKGHQISDRINNALSEAAHADEVIAQRLRHYTDNAKNGTGLDLGTATTELTSKMMNIFGGEEDLLAKGMPAANASPTEVNSWWNGLTADEQQRLVKDHPDLIGNRDGIPAEARNTANRAVLPGLIKDLENKPNRTEDEQTKLDGFKKIQGRLAEEDGKGNPPVFLMAIGTEGQGRAAISFGNPDTADDVVAYVPGLGTKVGDVGGKDGNRAKDLWTEAQKADPSRSTASITWLGYDAPQLKGAEQETLAVAGTQRAEQGGAGYQQFLQGLRSTHEGTPAHVTALGHSYGSLTVGQAAQRPGGIPADDIILVGSPGTGAQKADQLGVGSQHVWVGSAEHDPVTHLPSHSETNGMLGGAGIGLVTGGIPGAVVGGFIGDQVGKSGDPHELWFGQDPASSEFGGRRFDVADGEWQHSHSDYWNQDSGGSGGNSLRNLGSIVSGHGDRVNLQEPR